MRFLSLLLLLMGGVAYADTDKVAFLPTFSAAVNAISPPAVPTDICTITGSDTRTVRVNRVFVSNSQGSAGHNRYFLVKRSSANVGGVGSAMTPIPHLSGGASASTSAFAYTSNPITLGTTVGTLRVISIPAPASSTTVTEHYQWDFDQDGGNQPIFLVGAAETLALNFNGASLPGSLSVNCGFQWNEF